jgi:ATP synthase protein I
VNSAAVTFAEKSTKTSEQPSDLSSEATQLAAAGDVLVANPTASEVQLADQVTTAQVTTAQVTDQVTAQVTEEQPQGETTLLLPPSETSMQDYYRLEQNLLGLTLAFGAVIFPCVWAFYSLPIALDYLLGACAGTVYLRMLGNNVSRIGRQKKNSSIGRLAVFAGVMIVALRWEQLAVIPVFLGFLTYKAAIIAFILWTVVKPQQKPA